ncbi:MAG: hypothetical protein HUU46_19800 [Candidatus Hydrogenedentes bacterium]|nr:hypothetical protein [Candidatus Hydrogenedentota bacterium]
MTSPALEDWLKIATQALCKDAKVRITREVAAHYLAAYEEALRDGLSEDAAHAWAVTALGEPTAAHKRFLQTYLTIIELKTLREVVRRRSALYKAFFVALFVGFLWMEVAVARRPPGQWDFDILVGGIGVALSLLVSPILPALFGRRSPRAVLIARTALLPPAVLLTFTYVFGKALEDSLEREESYKVFGAEELIWPLAVSAALCVTCGITLATWPRYWSLVTKLRHKHNRDAAGL